MARTTIDIDTPILNEIKRLQHEEGLSMGKLISRLLADALSLRRSKKQPDAKFRWIARQMNPLVDLSDKEAVYAVLDRNDE